MKKFSVAITGGIGSGKTTVAKLLAKQLKWRYESVDEAVHQLYQDAEVSAELTAKFGTGDRREIGRMWYVMADDHRKELENIFRAPLLKVINGWINADDDLPLIVEFPLLFEMKAEHLFTKTVGVMLPLDEARQRALRRSAPKLTTEQVTTIMSRQLSPHDRARKVDYMINTGCSSVELEDRVKTLGGTLARAKLIDQPVRSADAILAKLKSNNEPARTWPLPLAPSESFSLVPKYQYGVVAGSFDPITLGHAWIIEQALTLVQTVKVLVAYNPAKSSLFDPEDRMNLIVSTVREVIGRKAEGRVAIEQLPQGGSVVEAAKRFGAKHVFRGIRSVTDLEYETQLNLVQSKLDPDLLTVYLMPPRHLIEVSSSMVKSLTHVSGWEAVAADYVSPSVFRALKKRAERPPAGAHKGE